MQKTIAKLSLAVKTKIKLATYAHRPHPAHQARSSSPQPFYKF